MCICICICICMTLKCTEPTKANQGLLKPISMKAKTACTSEHFDTWNHSCVLCAKNKCKLSCLLSARNKCSVHRLIVKGCMISTCQMSITQLLAFTHVTKRLGFACSAMYLKHGTARHFLCRLLDTENVRKETLNPSFQAHLVLCFCRQRACF